MEQENLNVNGLENPNKEEMLKRIQGKCAKQRVLFWGLFLTALLFFFYNFPIENKADSIGESLLLALAVISAFNIWWYGKMSKTDDVKQFLTKWVKSTKWINLITSFFGGLFFGFFLGEIIEGPILERMELSEKLLTIAFFVLLTAGLILIFIFTKKLTKDDDIKSLRELEGI